MIPTWMYEQEERSKNEPPKQPFPKNSGLMTARSEINQPALASEQNYANWNSPPPTSQHNFGNKEPRNNPTRPLVGQNEPQSTNPSKIMDSHMKNRALQNMLGRLQNNDPRNSMDPKQWGSESGQNQNSELSSKNIHNSLPNHYEQQESNQFLYNTPYISHANQNIGSFSSSQPPVYEPANQFTQREPLSQPVSSSNMNLNGLHPQNKQTLIQPINNMLNHKAIQDVGRNQVSFNQIPNNQYDNTHNLIKKEPSNSSQYPFSNRQYESNSFNHPPSNYSSMPQSSLHENVIPLKRNPQMPPPPKLPPKNGAVVFNGAVNPQHIGRRNPGITQMAQNFSQNLNAQPQFQPHYGRPNSEVVMQSGNSLQPKTQEGLIKPISFNYPNQIQATNANSITGFQKKYAHPTQNNRYQEMSTSPNYIGDQGNDSKFGINLQQSVMEETVLNQNYHPYSQQCQNNPIVSVEENPQIRNSELLEKLQSISQCEPVKKEILQILIDGQIHPGFEILRTIKKSRYMGSVAFGVIMYNLIENFGTDMVLKDEQQGVEFFRLNKRLKELCELSFCEVEVEDSD